MVASRARPGPARPRGHGLWVKCLQSHCPVHVLPVHTARLHTLDSTGPTKLVTRKERHKTRWGWWLFRVLEQLASGLALFRSYDTRHNNNILRGGRYHCCCPCCCCLPQQSVPGGPARAHVCKGPRYSHRPVCLSMGTATKIHPHATYYLPSPHNTRKARLFLD